MSEQEQIKEFQMYPPERIEEILNEFQAILVQADNSGSSKSTINNAVDYTKFWHGLRREGANLLGLSRHLLTELVRAETLIDELGGDRSALIGEKSELEQLVHNQDMMIKKHNGDLSDAEEKIKVLEVELNVTEGQRADAVELADQRDKTIQDLTKRHKEYRRALRSMGP